MMTDCCCNLQKDCPEEKNSRNLEINTGNGFNINVKTLLMFYNTYVTQNTMLQNMKKNSLCIEPHACDARTLFGQSKCTDF